MAIVDQYGKPIEASALNARQSEEGGRGSLYGQALGRRYSTGAATAAITPQRLHSALMRGAQGDITAQAEVFAGMEDMDGHLFAEMSKRRRAILTLESTISPPPGSGRRGAKLAAMATDLLSQMRDFEEVQTDLMDAVGHSYAALELRWEFDGQNRYIAEANHKPQTIFKLQDNWVPPGRKQDLMLQDGSVGGAKLWQFGWVVHVQRARSGILGCQGLYRTLSWPFVFKNFATRDFAEFLEVFGLPMRVGTYPAGTTDAQKREYLRALLALGHNAAGVFPEGMVVDFKEAVKGKGEGFLSMMEYMDKIISKAVLGQTLSSGGDGGGSYALGKVHREVQLDILAADAKNLASTITQDIIYPLLAVNAGITSMKECPTFKYTVTEDTDLSALADALPKIVSLGTQVPVSWVNKKFGIPQVLDGEPVLAIKAVSKPVNVPMHAQNHVGAFALSAQQADAAASLEQTMSDATQSSINDVMSNIYALVNTAKSLQDVQAGLLRIYGALDATALTKIMELGFAVAALRGIDDVQAENAEAQ